MNNNQKRAISAIFRNPAIIYASISAIAIGIILLLITMGLFSINRNLLENGQWFVLFWLLLLEGSLLTSIKCILFITASYFTVSLIYLLIRKKVRKNV